MNARRVENHKRAAPFKGWRTMHTAGAICHRPLVTVTLEGDTRISRCKSRCSRYCGHATCGFKHFTVRERIADAF